MPFKKKKYSTTPLPKNLNSFNSQLIGIYFLFKLRWQHGQTLLLLP